jgi:hypothetical protein
MEMTSISSSASTPTALESSPLSERKYRSKPKVVYDKQFQMTGPKLKAMLKKILLFHVSLLLGFFLIIRLGKYFVSFISNDS